jgi:predicted nucleic acid-binding Zn finger protein
VLGSDLLEQEYGGPAPDFAGSLIDRSEWNCQHVGAVNIARSDHRNIVRVFEVHD